MSHVKRSIQLSYGPVNEKGPGGARTRNLYLFKVCMLVPLGAAGVRSSFGSRSSVRVGQAGLGMREGIEPSTPGLEACALLSELTRVCTLVIVGRALPALFQVIPFRYPVTCISSDR
jgi:hypothetical protein